MPQIDRSIAIRSLGWLLLSLAIVAGLSLLLFSHSDFRHWGSLIGPVAWLVSCAAAAMSVGLGWKAGLIGAVVAGIPSGIATAIGFHWLGIPIGAVCFSVWMGTRGARPRSTA